MPLPADTARCLDTSCPDRLWCARFTERSTGTDSTTAYIATCWTIHHPETSYPGFIAVAASEQETTAA